MALTLGGRGGLFSRHAARLGRLLRLQRGFGLLLGLQEHPGAHHDLAAQREVDGMLADLEVRRRETLSN
eukprot:5297949-Prymnesium_polylepis.4